MILSSILRVDVDDDAAVGDDNNIDPSDALRHRLRIYSIFILATSIFFWIWAVLNTIHLRRRHRGGGGGDDDGGMMMMMDLGIISFLGTMVSASCSLRRSVLPTMKSVGYCCCCRGGGRGMIESNNNNHNHIIHHTHTPPGKCLRTFTILTQLTVVANYVLGILFAFTAGGADHGVYIYFASYCTIFALIWLLAAYVGWVIITVYKEAVVIREYRGGDEAVVQVDNEEDIQQHQSRRRRRRRRRNSVCQQLLQNLLLAAWMNNNNSSSNTHHQSKTERQQEQHKNKINYDDDEEDDMDDELLAILKGQGGYST